ncbi:dephospho-CoA kinase [Flavisolibacter tropicus]|uniref:Dephospho-CoA kinase n=1 Tax=Flavisolibacter tropicus TaxID=1492898 RepID=A0A172TSK6_9BACT|nr:dephospho-CoA kinase [Flavisolibacter tropicus]ANE49767.1 dephospho-CoA kinase [Flavisolibacter tropicus]
MILKIGLTGGIGSGKSTVAKVFELLGIPVYYADTASKLLYQTNQELMSSIKKYFGEEMYEGGNLNRSKLAAAVFGNDEKLQLLNSLVHPPTIKDAEDWMAKQTAPYIIKEAALLFEAGSASGLDYIIGVQAPKHLRLKRAMDRDGATREDILNRMNRQIDETIKMRLSDFVIRNDEQELVIPQVISLHNQLLQLAAN